MSLELFWNTRSNAVMAAETCSKAILALCRGHGKSPCFSTSHLSRAVGLDWRVPFFIVVDGAFFHD